MPETLTISALAKRSGVPSKTLRYWEGLGLLPKATRTHTGYRVFSPDVLRYVAFIRKSKAIGLTLAEMREALRLVRAGHCPCPEVVHWTEAKVTSIREQIRSLSAFLERLQRIRREWIGRSCSRGECREVCYLVEELPECKSLKGGKRYAQTLDHDQRCCGSACCDGVASHRGGKRMLSTRMLPALSLQVKRTVAGHVRD
ncbi:MAG TPA: MerR family transcriptional regulator [Candidatus Acidoferrales bacterium]|nr:MerR family transcriptional regulator [Candidatus Acidoferrales bacterium]